MIWAAAAVQLGYVGTGLVVLRALGLGSRSHLFRLLVVAYLVGMAAQIGVLYAIVAFAAIPPLVSVAMSALGLAALVAFSARRLLLSKVWLLDLTDYRDAVRRAPLKLALVMVLAMTMSAPVAQMVRIGLRAPVFGSDGISIWASKAVAIFHGEHLRSGFFVDGDRVHAHRGYPVVFPLFQFQHLAITGGGSDLVVTNALLVATCLWLVAFIGILSEWAGFPIAMASGVLICFMPAWYDPNSLGTALSGFADFPLGALSSLGAGLLLWWLATRDRLALVGAAAAWSLVGSIKEEGGLWVAVALAACALTLAALRRMPNPVDVAILLMPLFSLGVRGYFHRHIPSTADLMLPGLDDLLALPGQSSEIWGLLRETLLDGQIVGLVPLVALIGFAIGVPRNLRNPLAAFSLLAPVMWVAYLVVMALTEVQLGMLEHYGRVTFPRLALQIAPVSLLLAVVLNSPSMICFGATRHHLDQGGGG